MKTPLIDETHSWVEIPSYPGYSVCNNGAVRNERTGRPLAVQSNHGDIAYVALWQEGRQRNVLLSRLVANAFLPASTFRAFDTLINRDGDRLNNAVNNLMWRPRWFAMKYHRQFSRAWENSNPVVEVETEQYFEGVLSAAIAYGLLAMEIFTNAMNYTYYDTRNTGVWPTGQQFKMFFTKNDKPYTIPRQIRGV